MESNLSKDLQKNVLENTSWPEAPKSGWINNQSWFNQIGDLLRTQFVCKYIDGVEFIGNSIELLAKKHSLTVKNELQATAEGYYVGHVDIDIKFIIIDTNFEPIEVIGKFEIQITTQLKEVVKQLLHVHYEKNRTKNIRLYVK